MGIRFEKPSVSTPEKDLTPAMLFLTSTAKRRIAESSRNPVSEMFQPREIQLAPVPHQPGLFKLDGYLSVFRVVEVTEATITQAAQELQRNIGLFGVGLIIDPIGSDQAIYASMLTPLDEQGIHIHEEDEDFLADLAAIVERRTQKKRKHDTSRKI